MAFMLKELDHVQLAAPPGSEDLSRNFYGELLGMKEVEKPESLKKRGGVWFQFGSSQLHIGIEEPFTPARKAHPALVIENLDELKLHLKANQVPFKEDSLLPGADRIYVDDPFGNRLEMLEWK
ncbi:glyoxalase [Mesobacillus campisalis]|uniref:Glyoxalase n=1 Tax=Mesobacillus campisalis TaxID=1408103 RepID=A0A0M2SS52_9BACI|nr:VOC family protein [Mesobacillus campisalis]KKK36526.1 glyoxalase [Mesobacillus campisalis]